MIDFVICLPHNYSEAFASHIIHKYSVSLATTEYGVSHTHKHSNFINNTDNIDVLCRQLKHHSFNKIKVVVHKIKDHPNIINQR
jgi:hypothetical protein